MWELGGLLTPAFALAFFVGIVLGAAAAWALLSSAFGERVGIVVCVVSLALVGDVLLGLSSDGWLDAGALHIGLLGWVVYALPLLMVAAVVAAALVSVPAVASKHGGRQLDRGRRLRLVAAVGLVLWLPIVMGIPWIESRMFF